MLEQQRVSRALEYAKEATLGYARLEDREGEGIGFLTTGMFRHYSGDFRGAVRDMEASLKRPMRPYNLFSAHQIGGFSCLALDRVGEARAKAAQARELAAAVPSWLVAKLDWLESRLTHGTARLELLQAARAGLCPNRPADCALVTIELIEEALALERHDLAAEEALRLFALLDRDPGPRIENAVARLVRHRTRLTSQLVAEVRQSLDRAQDGRLSHLAAFE